MTLEQTFGSKRARISCCLALVVKAYRREIACLVLLTFFSVLPVFGATITVSNTNDSGAGSLRQAIIDAAPGDTIDFSVTGTITLTSGELGIGKNLTIVGPGAGSLTVSGNNTFRVFSISLGVRADISGLTLANGNGVGISSGTGGGILNNGTLTLTDCTVSANFASGAGGGIANIGPMTLSNTTVSGNSGFFGGGIANFRGLAVTDSVIAGNSSHSSSGGGVYSDNNLVMTTSTVSGNSSLFSGGGIENFGSLTITNSTVSGNSIRPGGNRTGGGIFNSSGPLSLTNTTVSDNIAGRGAGIYTAGTVTLTNITVSRNSAAEFGGGIVLGSLGLLHVKNSIVANQLSGGNCLQNATAISYGHNLSDTFCSFFTDATDLTTPSGLDPLGLQPNGGPTQTIALVAGGAALDAIPTSPTNFCTAIDGTTPIATDQRNVARPQSSACDIGAFELVQDDAGPISSNVQASPSPVAINVATTLTANVDDTATGGSNIASAAYTIDGGPPIPMDAADAAFDEVSEDVTASVAPFAATGVYSLCVNGTDVPENVGDPECALLPVYDPTGGFVTGGGFVNSPESADLENPSAAGPARFGFVSKYLPGRSTPDGNLEFQFQAGSLNFKSTSMDWLVVTGQPRGQFQGTGTINGATVCKFAVDAWDASFAPGGVDAFGLRIFACGAGGDRYSLPPTPLTKGSIIIHRQ